MKNKIKSYSFWVSLSGAIVLLVEAIGRVFGFIANADLINNIIMSIAGVLVVFGIVSLPTENQIEDIVEDESEENEENSEDKED